MSGLIKVLVFKVPYKEFKAQGISLEDIGHVEDIWNFTSDYADHFDCYLFRFDTINPSSPILTERISSSSKEPLKEKSLNNKSNEVSNAKSISNCLEKEALASASLAEKEVNFLKSLNCSTCDENFEDVKILKLHKKKIHQEEKEHIEKGNVDDFSGIRRKKPESKSEAREDKQEREFENLNNAKSKLNLQNHLMQRGSEVSKETTINHLESSLKEANADFKNEIYLTNSLKERNAEKEEGLERSNVKVKSELEKTKLGIQPLENPVPIAERPKDENEAISRDEMLSAASEIIKDKNDLIEKLEQELSELRTGQQMGVAQALQALLFMFSLYVAFYFCDYFARFE